MSHILFAVVVDVVIVLSKEGMLVSSCMLMA